MFQLGAENIRWFFFLFAGILFAVLGVLFPNWFKELSTPRPHNEIKLFNECLARHQFAYFSYFFALTIGATFDPNYPWVRNVGWVAIGLSLGFYGYGLFCSAIQDRRISKYHKQACTSSTECDLALSKKFAFKLCRLNVIFAVLSWIIAIGATLLVRPTSKPVP
jgi:hypothetical protein